MKDYYDGDLFSNKAKDYYMEKVLEIAENYTDEKWLKDGGYIVNEDDTKLINIYDYIEGYFHQEYNGNLDEYVKSLIDESED